MKALVRRSLKGGDVGLLDLPEPHPEAGQIKIKVEYAGICGSDAKMFNQDIAPGARTKPPIVLGHEGVGIVVEVGEGVTNVKVGDRVARGGLLAEAPPGKLGAPVHASISGAVVQVSREGRVFNIRVIGEASLEVGEPVGMTFVPEAVSYFGGDGCCLAAAEQV